MIALEIFAERGNGRLESGFHIADALQGAEGIQPGHERLGQDQHDEHEEGRGHEHFDQSETGPAPSPLSPPGERGRG